MSTLSGIMNATMSCWNLVVDPMWILACLCIWLKKNGLQYNCFEVGFVDYHYTNHNYDHDEQLRTMPEQLVRFPWRSSVNMWPGIYTLIFSHICFRLKLLWVDHCTLCKSMYMYIFTVQQAHDGRINENG